MKRPANIDIRATATDVTAHELVDFGIARVRIFCEQCCRSHDLPRLAVPALRHIDLGPRRLDGMTGVRREALNCGYLLPATEEIFVEQERNAAPLM